MKKQLRKIHRWVGLTSAIWLLLLATTGFLLQHSHDWKLDHKYISNVSVLNFYGIGDQYIAFESNNHQIQQLDKQIIQDGKSSLKLQENMVAAIHHEQQWVIATNTQVLWINSLGEISKSRDEFDGLSFPIDSLGKINGQIVYKQNEVLSSLETNLPANTNSSEVNWSTPTINQAQKDKAIQQTSHDYLTYEKVIFDIHAGITTPGIVNDIAAIALIILSLSGIFLFFRKKKTNR